MTPAEAEPSRPGPRPGLVLWSGYHSAQVDVEVRLNTNESPLPPPEVASRSSGRGRRGRSTSTATPTGAATELRAGPGRPARGRADEVFCANGSNEVLQCLLLAYGGPGRGLRAVRADLRAALPHRPVTGTAVVAGDRRRRLPHRLPTLERCSRRWRRR